VKWTCRSHKFWNQVNEETIKASLFQGCHLYFTALRITRIFLVQVEYEVESCTSTDAAGNGCIDIKRNSVTMPTGGYVVYAVAHQHAGGIGSTLYGQVIFNLFMITCSRFLDIFYPLSHLVGN
jgi:hypothetical protein